MPLAHRVRRGAGKRPRCQEKAIFADKKYKEAVPDKTSIACTWRTNRHMLAFNAMMQGQSEKASAPCKR